MFDFLAVSANIMGAYLLDFAGFLAAQIFKVSKLFFNVTFTSLATVATSSSLFVNFLFSGMGSERKIVSKFIQSSSDGSYSLVTKFLNK